MSFDAPAMMLAQRVESTDRDGYRACASAAEMGDSRIVRLAAAYARSFSDCKRSAKHPNVGATRNVGP